MPSSIPRSPQSDPEAVSDKQDALDSLGYRSRDVDPVDRLMVVVAVMGIAVLFSVVASAFAWSASNRAVEAAEKAQTAAEATNDQSRTNLQTSYRNRGAICSIIEALGLPTAETCTDPNVTPFISVGHRSAATDLVCGLYPLLGEAAPPPCGD